MYVPHYHTTVMFEFCNIYACMRTHPPIHLNGHLTNLYQVRKVHVVRRSGLNPQEWIYTCRSIWIKSSLVHVLHPCPDNAKLVPSEEGSQEIRTKPTGTNLHLGQSGSSHPLCMYYTHVLTMLTAQVLQTSPKINRILLSQ